MILPGLSNERIPMRIRLYIAIALTGALSGQVEEVKNVNFVGSDILKTAGLIVSQLLIGALLGVSARIFILALETGASAIAAAIGLGNSLGVQVTDGDQLPSIATFIVFSVTTLIFVTDLHWGLIWGLAQSYVYAPLDTVQDGETMTRHLLQVLRKSYLLAFQISSPFLAFSIIVNLAFGFLNRLAPHVPVYFLSAPLLIVGGLYWFYGNSADFFSTFIAEFSTWVTRER